MKNLLQRLKKALRGRDKGTVAVTFLLSLPVLLLVIGIFVQYALLVNARLTLERALDAAARSAMTSVTANETTEFVNAQENAVKSACMVLAPISPMASQESPDGQKIADALRATGVKVFDSFAKRYTFAEQATVLTLSAPQDPRNRGTECTVTISYPFLINVPAVRMFVGTQARLGGVPGRYFTFTVSRTVQLSPGREVVVSTTGVPQ